MNSKFFKKLEYQGLENLYANSPRNQFQTNRFNLADAELIKLQSPRYLATSTDSVAIEIHSGLYKDPETWGYLAIANSVSDLAATGTKPIGMLVSAQWSPAHVEKTKIVVYKAMSHALRKFKVPLLGGDSGASAQTVLSTTILGESRLKPLSREGVDPGDLILSFGSSFGWGPAVALNILKFESKFKFESQFRPDPNWQTCAKFRSYFKASIDTSDGIYNALETLSKINDVQFSIDLRAIKLPAVLKQFHNKYRVPIEYFIESDLGDLQTCVAIAPTQYSKIKNKLPFHTVLATADRLSPSIRQSEAIQYFNSSSPKKLKFIGNYESLPQLVEKYSMNYKVGLRKWFHQYQSLSK